MGESSVMKTENCLTPASPSDVNMVNAGFQALGNRIASAAADTLGTAAIKVNNQSIYLCFMQQKIVLFIVKT